jgi:NADH-quinone oxidoreductase subunit L
MTVPLIFLAAVTCVAGFIPFGHFTTASGLAYDIHLDTRVMVTSVIVALISIAIATFIYRRDKQPVADKLQAEFPRLHHAAYKRFYMDEVYQYVTHRIIFRHISTPIAWLDRHVVDGFMNFLAWGTNATSYRVRALQSGAIQQYGFVFLLGVLALILLMIL